MLTTAQARPVTVGVGWRSHENVNGHRKMPILNIFFQSPMYDSDANTSILDYRRSPSFEQVSSVACLLRQDEHMYRMRLRPLGGAEYYGIKVKSELDIYHLVNS